MRNTHRRLLLLKLVGEMFMVTLRPVTDPGTTDRAALAGAEVVEVHLLLPARQASALEAAAHQQGLTTGQLIRRLVRGFLDEPHADRATD